MQYVSLCPKQFCNTDPLPFARQGSPRSPLQSTSIPMEVAMMNWPEMLHHAEEWAAGFWAGAGAASLIVIAGAGMVLLIGGI